ncbi:MAG: rhamnulokinase [Ancalomicrobiaceae bacterium]|nr:rhamnulokinase [Ancalomicrobiaceae bacterium]
MDKTIGARAARVAAVDMGSSTGRVMVADLQDGHITLEEAHRFETPQFRDAATGYDVWDADAIVGHIRDGLEQMDAIAPIDSVGCETWGVDYVLLDAEGRRVGPAVTYRDHRTDGMIEAVTARMDRAEIYRRSGIHFHLYNTLYQLAATAKHHPEWLEAARHLLFTPDYLHYALSGVISNEYTIATTSQMLSIETRDWDPELMKLAGLPRQLMLKPVEPGTILGEARLKSGRSIKVIAPGGHDTASAVAAAPLDGPDEAYLSSGTWSLMGIESEHPFTGPEALAFNIGNEGGVCGRYTVLKNIMGLWLIQRARKELGSPDFASLVAAAEAAPAWASLIDPDDQRFLNPPNMIETIKEYARTHGEVVPEGPGAIARCVFDSLALEYARVKGELETLRGRPITRVRIIGGGSKNALLNQLTADACGVTVSAGPVETSSLGNACLQMMALGAISSLAEARAIVRKSFSVKDIVPREAVPEAVRERFRALSASDKPH